MSMLAKAQFAVMKHWAAAAILGIVAAMALIVRLEGRVWFCRCQQVRFFVADGSSSHTSQHLFDPYSVTHLQHGLLLYLALAWAAPRTTWQARLVAAVALEALWEIVENSEYVVNRYREQTAALGYLGDSVLNALGDVLPCIAGFAIAGKLGWRWTLALFAVLEAAVIAWIRDSLLLNVLMLLWPVEAVKQWQLGR
jgi:hypothetical protein